MLDQGRLMVQRGWKVEIAPTEAQARALAQSVGVARWVYNWTLGQRQDRYKMGALAKNVHPNVLNKELTERIRHKEVPGWVSTLSSYGRREAQADVGLAYDNAFRRIREGRHGKAIGWPKFRNRLHTRFHYSVSGGGTCRIERRPDHDYVTLTGIPGSIRVRERRYLPVGVEISNIAYVRHAGRHYLSVEATVPHPEPRGTHVRGVIGIDVGLKTTLVLSDGRQYSAPKPLKNAASALARARRTVSRKYEARKVRNGTVGVGKALGPIGTSEKRSRDQVARLEAEVARIRADWQNKLTTMLAKKYNCIRIENLSVQGLVRGRGSKSWADIGWGEIRRQLTYKCEWYGCKLEVADRYFPSTQLCSVCEAQTGPRGQESLGVRKWTCSECQTVHDRDRNAATNLKDFPDWSQDQSGVWRRGLTSSIRAVSLSGQTVPGALAGPSVTSQLGTEVGSLLTVDS